jgi:pilus assembly protein CpaE
MIAAVISEDAVLRARLEAVLKRTLNVDSVLTIPEYPDAASILTLEDGHEKYVAFIDFRDHSDRALALAGDINRTCPSVGSVALNVGSSQTDLIAIVRAGICEVLPQPFSDQDVGTAVVNVTRKLAGDPNVTATKGVICAFLPAKPGSGASTLAVYSALACARIADSHPLLLDFDIRLGTSSFVLKLDSKNSIMDAFENASRMDETLWVQLLSQREKLDVLGSAPTEFGVRVHSDSFQSILRWARSRHTAVVVDLAGTMEDFEIATLQQAGMIFLVCGPDLTSLHMARRRMEGLRLLQLHERVCLVMNRVDKRTGLSIRDIESVLGMPVQITVPADEASIAKAVHEGMGVNPKGAFGLQIEVIAHKMAGKAPNGQNSGSIRPRKQFIEFFSIPQAKGLDPSRL